jgi:hypothetical protein
VCKKRPNIQSAAGQILPEHVIITISSLNGDRVSHVTSQKRYALVGQLKARNVQDFPISPPVRVIVTG